MLTVTFEDGTQKNIQVEETFDWRRYPEVKELVLEYGMLEEFKKVFPTFPWPERRVVIIVGEMAKYMSANFFD